MSALIEAITLYVLYVGVVGVIWWVKHVDYTAMAESRRSILDGIVVPIGVALLVPVIGISVLGWWGPVLHQPRVGPSWALVVPVLMALTFIAGMVTIGWRSAGAAKLPLLGVGVVFVGVAEELVTRGVLIVGARDAGWPEVGVFFFSTGLFALLHGINAVFGLTVRQTAAQIGLTFVAGTALYVGRMATGSLVICMVLHAGWDFAVLGNTATDRKPRLAQLLLTVSVYLAGLIALWPVIFT